MPEKEYAFDLGRIFLGNLPWFYLAEVILRTTVMYLYALLRLLGKRGMGQLAPFDFVIIIALGSAVGDPMFYPDVPVPHAMAVITVVVVLTRSVGFLTQRNRWARECGRRNARPSGARRRHGPQDDGTGASPAMSSSNTRARRDRAGPRPRCRCRGGSGGPSFRRQLGAVRRSQHEEREAYVLCCVSALRRPRGANASPRSTQRGTLHPDRHGAPRPRAAVAHDLVRSGSRRKSRPRSSPPLGPR
jgi:hypothetical protein